MEFSYSINNGSSWSTSGTFTALDEGSYDIVVRNDSTGCITTFGSSTVLDAGACVEICADGMDNDDDGLVDCDDPDCYNAFDVQVDPSVELASEGLLCLPGSIEITALGTGGFRALCLYLG